MRIGCTIAILILLSVLFSIDMHAQHDSINRVDHIGRRVGLWVWKDVASLPYRKAWYSEAGEDSSYFCDLKGERLQDIVVADELLLTGHISVDSLKRIHQAVIEVYKQHYSMPPEGVGLVVSSFLVWPDKSISQIRIIQGLSPEINFQVYTSIQQMDTSVLSCCIVDEKPMLVFLPVKF